MTNSEGQLPPIFRCAAPSEFEGLNPYRPTRRPPGNIPYLVDNVWEWLRPASMPSRRHSAYGSPTPQLARIAAGSPEVPSDRPVGVVEFPGEAVVAQCPQRDARMHPDVARLPKIVLGAMAHSLDGPLEGKLALGRLYLPVLSAEEVAGILSGHPGMAGELRTASSFWSDARVVQGGPEFPHADGEIFFSAPGGYRLKAYTA